MPEFVNPPQKRHESLQPLSRDHYVGLVESRHLARSAAAGADARRKALADFLRAWDGEIVAHFRDEERLLPQLLPADAAGRLRREHEEITRLAEDGRAISPAEDPGAEWAGRLGRLLEAHIRWEEREAFPLVERTATAHELERLREATAEVERSRDRRVRR